MGVCKNCIFKKLPELRQGVSVGLIFSVRILEGREGRKCPRTGISTFSIMQNLQYPYAFFAFPKKTKHPYTYFTNKKGAKTYETFRRLRIKQA